MTEWRECKLKDVCKYERISINPQKYKILQFVHYSFPAFDNNKTPEIQFGGQIKSSKYIVKKGYILYNKLNVRFKRIWNINFETPENSICSSEFLPILATKCNQDYLYYFLCSDELTDTMANSNTGTSGSHQRIDPNFLMKYDILLPPLPEQKAIAEVLSSLDDKIDLLTRQNKTLEDLAQAYFRKWFIEDASDKWEEKGLDEIADFLNGLPLQKYPYKTGNPLHVIKIKELNNGFTDSSDLCSADIPEQYIVHPGDVIFSWSGSLKVDIWKYGKGALNQHLFKVTSCNYPKWFYYFWIKYHLPEFKMIAESKATTMGHIQRRDLSNAIVLVPENQEINNMDNIMSPLIKKIEQNNAQILVLQKLRDTLLPKLISGEIRVKM